MLMPYIYIYIYVFIYIYLYTYLLTYDSFKNYSQGDHVWPPLSVDFSMSPASQVSIWAAT